MTTREEWLKRGVRALRPLLEKAGLKMRRRWQVSMSLTPSRRAIGGCVYEPASLTGDTVSLLICPSHVSGADVLDTLFHEMIHASLPRGVHHGAKFQKVCRAVGMTRGKPTEAGAGPELRQVLERLAVHLGDFPHTAMFLSGKSRTGTKGGYWPVFQSPVEPRYRVQVSERSLQEFGPPLCPRSGRPMEPAPGKAPKWGPKPGPLFAGAPAGIIREEE